MPNTQRIIFFLPVLACVLLLNGCGTAPPSTKTADSAATDPNGDFANSEQEVSYDETGVMELTEQTFASVISNSSQPVLVDFWAPWCGPCKLMGPVIEGMAAEQAAGAVYAKINVDDAPAISDKYDIRSIPAFLIFKDGEEVERLIGVQAKEKIEAALQAAS